MKRLMLSLVLLIIAAGNVSADEPKTVTIPLDQIWAFDMPETRNIEELRSKQSAPTAKLLLDQISRSWMESPCWLQESETAGPGFVVAGSGLQALQSACAIITDKQKPLQSLSSNDDVTVVYFSYPVSGDFVHLRKVERRGDSIDISFRLQPYFERHIWFTVALIPLGKLPAGEYHVEMRQLPTEQKYVDWGFSRLNVEYSRRFVCKSFSFVVVDHGNDRSH